LKGHAQHTWQDRERSSEEVRQEIQGRLPKGPFEFSADLTFDDVKAEAKSGVVARLQRAVRRDARYATAGHPYIIAFGLSQALRTIYDGSKQIIDGGGE
jgi:hypothetical protein